MQNIIMELDLQSLIAILPGYVYLKDMNGKYLACNDGKAQILGYKLGDDLIGLTDTEINLSELQRNNELKAINNNAVNMFEEKVVSNGKEITILTKHIPLKNKVNEIIGVIGISIDIDEKKEREEQTWILEDIIGKIPGHVWWKDRNCRFLGCNDQQAKIAGLESRYEIKGKRAYDIITENQSEEERIRQAREIDNIDTKVIETGNGFTVEEPLVMPDGKEAIYLSRKEPLIDKNGNIIGMIGTSIDITAQKEKERLEQENLMIRAEENEKFIKSIKQMIHDLKSPLSSIDLVIDQLKKDKLISKLNSNTLGRAHKKIDAISRKLLKQYDTQQVEADAIEEFMVSMAVKETMIDKMDEHQASGVEFKVDIDRSAAFTFIRNNEIMFTRMISNLVNNAVEALKDHKEPKIEITLFHNKHQDKVMFVIRDNGYGMPEHIQEKFKAGISVTEGKEDGHGIGLTQIRDTIMLSNGKLDIVADGDGTEITIWFDAVKEAPAWSTGEIKLTRDDTIVVVDDDESIHGSWDINFKPILERAPTITVKHFSMAREAIDFINGLSAEQKQDVFLWTDYELSDDSAINGMYVINQTNVRRAVVVTSHYEDQELLVKVMERGVKLLPKEMAFSVKFLMDHKIVKGSKKVDIVWLEDQDWYACDLKERFYPDLAVDIYKDPVVFMEQVQQYPLDTRIILDTYFDIQSESLTQHEPKFYLDGYQIAQELHNMGYTKLIMLVGEMPPYTPPDYLTVFLKGDHEAEANLDKY